jgi:uncharacterized protein YbjT (DUF2867 family)
MSGRKIIVVFGATGQQGGSVVTTFLNDKKLSEEWLVRAVTRDVSKESAKNLAARGAEVVQVSKPTKQMGQRANSGVQADLSDKQSLSKAVSGAEVIFAVTNYWESMDAALEVRQGKDIVDVAKAAGTKHFIWSSLYDVNKCMFSFSRFYERLR